MAIGPSYLTPTYVRLAYFLDLLKHKLAFKILSAAITLVTNIVLFKLQIQANYKLSEPNNNSFP
jgi:hypothetical protein